mmetsp:Transcript_64484/g.153961  ORF Transcript_64484/g.153961 Transcript_64484/m.153961 type:complete len:242 (-) Transcript_64484:865-1590(-)
MLLALAPRLPAVPLAVSISGAAPCSRRAACTSPALASCSSVKNSGGALRPFGSFSCTSTLVAVSKSFMTVATSSRRAPPASGSANLGSGEPSAGWQGVNSKGLNTDRAPVSRLSLTLPRLSTSLSCNKLEPSVLPCATSKSVLACVNSSLSCKELAFRDSNSSLTCCEVAFNASFLSCAEARFSCSAETCALSSAVSARAIASHSSILDLSSSRDAVTGLGPAKADCMWSRVASRFAAASF